MPRELVHWKVAELCMIDFQRHSLKHCAELAAKYPEQIYIAALAHDAPYYYKLGKSEFHLVAEYLHGKDAEDTLTPIKTLATAILALATEKQAPHWAFLLGMLSHMAADIIFHPVIYYFTGNYYHEHPKERAKAQAAHRELEVYLDSWIRPQAKFPHGYRIDTLLKTNPANLKASLKLLDAHLTPELIWPQKFKVPKFATSRWFNSLDQMAMAQGLFLSFWAGLFMKIINTISCHRLDGFEHLCLLGRTQPLELFKSPMTYKNPVTGQSETSTCEELLHKSCALTLKFSKGIENILNGESVEKAFKDCEGLSLNYGLFKVRSDSARHFAR